MFTEISSDQIDEYRRDGVLVIENFLDGDELALWRKNVEDAVEQRQDRKLADGTMRSGDSFYDRVFTQRINLWMDHAGMRDLILDERIGKLAAELAGIDGIRVWHDQALIKEPWANPTAWHLDNPYWSFSSSNAISIWIALDDATLSNGCLYFLPGTHKEASFENSGITQEMADLFGVYPDWIKRKPLPGPMRAGDCSFHNGLTAHGAGANMTPNRRRAMTCAFMPDGSNFNGQKNVLPDSYVETLSVGDVLSNDELNPLVYRRRED
ncbi:MAG: phytanoyl-CoA dioxygenase family protein [Candidatus Latescibacterota bacterium]|nr:phytanoyl-CoA dioxygenase family protein [Candidatus Latescibacterota bacterium]